MTGSSPPPSLKRPSPSLENFLNGILPEDPVGPSLRYEPLYDDVRLARQEDDPRLSMGIWKTDLKKADWGEIESLCVEALTTKSKDLQIAAWLTEAWTALYEAEGYTRGIRLFSRLIETFWETIHPQSPEDGDRESRLMVFDWMDTAFPSRLMLIPLTRSKFEETAFGLGFFKSAQHNDAAQKRTENTARNTPSNNDPSKAIGTLDDFQRSLDQTPDAYLSKCQCHITEAAQATQALKDTLAGLLGAASPSFSKILGTLKEMERIVKAALQTREPPPPIEEPVEEPAPEMIDNFIPDISETAPETADTPAKKLGLQSREDAYRQLKTIAAFLEQSDPHSLAPQLLRQLIRWEHKNILDIFEEIAKTPQEYDILMKILGFPPERGEC